MSKTLNEHITALDYVDKTLLVLSSASVSLCSSTTVTGKTVGIKSANIKLLFLQWRDCQNISENNGKGKINTAYTRKSASLK